jgi:hypothetical protein
MERDIINTNIKFLQINLHHSKAATATFCQQLAEKKVDIALIQEPWLYKGQIRGLYNTGGTVYSVAPGNNARFYIYIRNRINDLPLSELCSRDTTTVRITYTYIGGCEEQIVASAYLPYDSDEPPPTKEMRDVIDYCQSRKRQLMIGCDANAPQILWGSTGINPRRESLLEFLVGSNLNILNHDNEPTFVVCNRKEVIDLTLGTNKINNLVSHDMYLMSHLFSDYRYIWFEIGKITSEQVTFRNPGEPIGSCIRTT